ncbi:unnamed protein product [Rhizophagus irregularis]|nr:unnamed protein product [Rhizophagus irregularis]
MSSSYKSSSYKCSHCSRTFTTPYALKRHISDKHRYKIDENEGSTTQMEIVEEPGLWDEDVSMKYSEDEETEEETEETEEETEEIEEETESITLEQNVESSDALSSSDDVPKKDERNENVDSEGEEETDINLTFPISIDNEDYCGTTLDDAIKDKNYPLNTNWPNDIYREFMEIITEYQLSNSCGDRLIKLVNSINNIDKNLLPKTTKEGRRFIDDSEFPYMKFKTVPITNFQDVEYYFHYQPIINGIKTLLLQSDINKEFVFQYQNNTVKTYGLVIVA